MKTVEEKAKRYDEALERAKKVNKCEADDREPGTSICEYIFPELCESSDESIRKAIYSALRYLETELSWDALGKVDILDAYAWLERQAKQKPTLPKWKYKKDNTPLLRDSIILNKYGCVAKSPSGAIISNAWVLDYDELTKLPKEEIEKQDEKKPTLRERYKNIAESEWFKKTHEGMSVSDDEEVDNVNKVEPKFKVGDYIERKDGVGCHAKIIFVGGNFYGCEKLIYPEDESPFFEFMFENQNEFRMYSDFQQKPADKTEPKFKVGDWIVDNCDYIWKIKEILNQFYVLEDIEGAESCPTIEWVNKNFHLWTIQDAKDGDVLFHSDSASNGIFIFKKLLKCGFSEKIICYCDYDSEDGFCLGEHHTCCWADAKILHPATKEQRDLLFQKMHEARYEWDAEKKELKNIGQKLDWSVEDEHRIKDTIYFLDTAKNIMQVQ